MIRLGSVVECDGRRHQVIAQASPSGYWALPTAGGPAVRLLVRKGEWRLVREFDARRGFAGTRRRAVLGGA